MAGVRETLERELKFGVDGAFRLPDLPGEPLDPRVFTSTYFDTGGLQLARVGATLRRRVENGEGLWQLKLPRGAARAELELPGAPTGPPPALLDLLVAYLRGADLEPIARLRTRRAGVRVRGIEGPIAEVTVDQVAVLDGRRIARRFTEIEVELVDGDENALRRIGRMLEQAGATEVDQRPKVFQALDVPAPPQLETPPPSAPLSEHLGHLIRVQLDAIVRHDPGTRLGRDIEELHQMRVATRRLRALLRASRAFVEEEWAESLRAELAWLGGALGAVRDLDVLLEYLHAEAATLDAEERRAFERLLVQLERERRKARSAMLEALRDARYLGLLDRLDYAAASPRVLPSEETLETIAAAEFRRLRKGVRALAEEPDDEELHALRIRGKRARYATEFAAETMTESVDRYVATLKAFQDVLGDHQDACVAEQRLRGLADRSTSLRASFAVGRLVERQRQRRAAARAQLRAAWKRVAKSGRRLWS